MAAKKSTYGQINNYPGNVRKLTKAATRRGRNSKCRWHSVKYHYSTNERQQMKKVEHSLRFITEFDETHPVAQRFFQLETSEQVLMLESMLKELILPTIQPEIDRINEGGSYAILKVAE